MLKNWMFGLVLLALPALAVEKSETQQVIEALSTGAGLHGAAYRGAVQQLQNGYELRSARTFTDGQNQTDKARVLVLNYYPKACDESRGFLIKMLYIHYTFGEDGVSVWKLETFEEFKRPNHGTGDVSSAGRR